MIDLAPEWLEALRESSAATVSTVLRKHGLHRVSLRGPRPLRQGQPRLVAAAATMRFIPAREDISTSESATGPKSARGILPHLPPGSVIVAAAHGITNAGVFGDIVAAHMRNMGFAGLVTDGPIRDLAGHLASDWPVWADGTVPPPSPEGLFLADYQVPVGIGGVSVFPGDVIIADDDGAVVVPRALVEAIAQESRDTERFEAWALAEVNAGAALGGLYPPNEQTMERYRREMAAR
ncbi:regulator of RNase E activity RraA [Novosphingobium chloroacetimidivorans]|uniref:Regulator of RNase E activity RraA n=1 Tax=Novosphingobium chloroacetimidivorans TaxID=1428314 RepID=A0A7W7K857_9SPHN|nr:ribonuclease activity regulator RraA [Novosphingobium chloroacetimidivorans]MBB4857966.1 regulator of RNase E activity RraA [Novosphingobium chloroacetimidivorans]